MSDSNDNDIYYGKPVDDDYIDVEKRRAKVRTTTEKPENDIQRDAKAAGHAPPQQDRGHFLDVESGSASSSEIDEMIDENAVTAHDGRAVTRTFFYTSEAPRSKRRKFRRMYRHQEGVGDPDRRSQNRPADRRRCIDTFCSQLDMTTHHKERVKHIIEGLEMSHMAHYSSPQVILATISLVATEDGRFIRDEPAFRGLLEDSGSDLKQLRSIRDLVRRKSDRI